MWSYTLEAENFQENEVIKRYEKDNKKDIYKKKATSPLGFILHPLYLKSFSDGNMLLNYAWLPIIFH